LRRWRKSPEIDFAGEARSPRSHRSVACRTDGSERGGIHPCSAAVPARHQGWRGTIGAADFGRAWPDGRIASRCPRLDLSGDVAKIIAMSDATEAILTRAERAGGLDAVSALIRRYQKVPRDPSLAPVFARMDPHHDDHVAAFIAEVTDRPEGLHG